MSTSKLLTKLPGFLLTTLGGLLSSDQQLVVQAITDGTYFHYDESLTGDIDGVNKTFTIAVAPYPTSSLEIRKQGVVQKNPDDYSITGTTITFVVAPEVGSWLTAIYVVSPV